MKKFLCIVFSSLLIAGAFVGCGDDSAEETTKAVETTSEASVNNNGDNNDADKDDDDNEASSKEDNENVNASDLTDADKEQFLTDTIVVTYALVGDMQGQDILEEYKDLEPTFNEMLQASMSADIAGAQEKLDTLKDELTKRGVDLDEIAQKEEVKTLVDASMKAAGAGTN